MTVEDSITISENTESTPSTKKLSGVIFIRNLIQMCKTSYNYLINNPAATTFIGAFLYIVAYYIVFNATAGYLSYFGISSRIIEFDLVYVLFNYAQLILLVAFLWIKGMSIIYVSPIYHIIETVFIFLFITKGADLINALSTDSYFKLDLLIFLILSFVNNLIFGLALLVNYIINKAESKIIEYINKYRENKIVKFLAKPFLAIIVLIYILLSMFLVVGVEYSSKNFARVKQHFSILEDKRYAVVYETSESYFIMPCEIKETVSEYDTSHILNELHLQFGTSQKIDKTDVQVTQMYFDRVIDATKLEESEESA